MLYSEALAYLYALTNYEKVLPATYSPATLNLDRMRALLAALGNPQDQFKSVHVAGTKGKGSTSAMMASCLQHLGLKTGLFTSPHLSSFRERIQINGQLIPPEVVGILVDKIKPLIAPADEPAEGDAPPAAPTHPSAVRGVTGFEAITALAFLHFARQEVEWAVIEVGLGGRLDSTNVITPQASIITSLSFDHTQLLGNTIGQIAREKAGIIKPGVPVISQSQPLEATQVIEAVAHENNSPMSQLARNWRWTPGATALGKQTFEVKQVSLIRSKNKPFVNDLEGWYEIQLMGKHQIDNATTVIAALDMIREPLRASGAQLTVMAVREGLRAAQWPGRFEVLRADPPVVVDGAHNIDSVNKLAVTLAESFPGKRWTFIFGCYKDKDAEGMIRALKPRAARWIMTQADNSRALPVDALLDIARSCGVKATGLPHIADALDAVINTNEAVCVTGSLAIVGDARLKWAMKTGAALPDTDSV